MNINTIITIVIILVIMVAPIIVVRYMMKARSLTRRADFLEALTFTTLQIDVPRLNEKTPLAAEQLFASIHGILRDDPITQEHISLEIVADVTSIRFYIFLPVHLQDFVEGQIYAQYPSINIKPVEDYARKVDVEGMVIAQSVLKLNKEDVYPIRTFVNFEVDPLAGITAVLSKLAPREQVWIQVCARPVGDDWQKKGLDAIKRVRSGGVAGKSNAPHAKAGRLIAGVFRELATPGSSGGGGDPSKPPELPGTVTEALGGIESKITKLGFETTMRITVVADTELAARTRIQTVAGAYKQFNTTNMNGFSLGEIKINDPSSWTEYLNRLFEHTGLILNTEELASIYHFPSESVATPNLAWAGSRKGEAPPMLPMKGEVDDEQITLLGETDFRNTKREFGIKMIDRLQHVYIIGKSGSGKSKLMLRMMQDDILEGRGVVLVDPHGELVDETLQVIPKNRLDDVIVFDPSDREFPIAFNLLEQVEDDFKGMVASGFVGIFKKIFGYSWGPRLEHILRNTVLALLDYPESTMLSIPRMLTEKPFREKVMEYIKDPVIQDFWVNEFGAMDMKMQTEAVSPILNKIGQFLSTPTIRNIVGQPKTAINIRQMMDESKILLVNLSRGKIGEDNASLMGAMMITKVQLAAMSRADLTAEQRVPCFLYVDEFQNFATESFATILSEARKYGLGLTIAHQYIAQMPEEVRDAVFGNVGTLISFRVGATDGEYLAKEYKPVFDETDFVNLEKYHIYIRLLIDGVTPPAFSATTLTPPKMTSEFLPEIFEQSRRKYSTARAEVEANIEEWSGMREKSAARVAAKEAGNILRQSIVRQGTALPNSTLREQGSAPGSASGSAPVTTTPIIPAQPRLTTTTAAPTAPTPRPVVAHPVAPPVEPPKAAPLPQMSQSDRGVILEPTPVSDLPVVEEPVDDLPATIPAEEGILPVPADEVTPQSALSPQEEGSGVAEVYQPKQLRVIGNRAYKEHTQRGGVKWYVGEPVEMAIAREQDRYKRSLAKLTFQEDSPLASYPQQGSAEEPIAATNDDYDRPRNPDRV